MTGALPLALPDEAGVDEALSRVEAALARLDCALRRSREQQLAVARETVELEVRHERLREVVGDALGLLDGLIATEVAKPAAPVDGTA
ncbi:hypothetical protein GTZ99_07455 [Novosphingobium sp. FSY-8]|uniref:DUF4164 family protein n=1 Tax=Novosphingobium ovatum TaxID=1908523 RepID=A0ABW9XD14_9SPHN|nr:hypothetical protein [Novosphingobium ovatum]NBC36390.1 hypothetical protein [Novosphingobium ovatum]